MELMGEPRTFGDTFEFQCYNCGLFRLSSSAAAIVGKTGYAPMERAKISYGLRRLGGNTLITEPL
jgi:hypothetical protein